MKFKKPLIIASFIGTTYGAAILLKDYLGAKYIPPSKNIAENKVILITGANTGIGKETTRELAKLKAKVIMACRNLTLCEEAREEIVLETLNKYIYCRKCDLSSQESITKFANQFQKEFGKLDVLINNAGVMRCPYSKTKEGIEMQLGVNHMGHFLLTNLLLDLLKKNAPSRIINVSSVSHKNGEIKKDDLNSETNYDGGEAYAQSKLANILFTRELAKRLEGSGVTVNAVHPGIVDTEITRHMSFFKSYTASIIIKPILWAFIKTPKQGSQTTLYAALEPSLEKITGKYFANCKEYDVGEKAKDDYTANWLWIVSEKWTKLNK